MTLGAVIEELASVGAPRALADGDVLCHQGGDSDSAFVIVSGALETTVAAGEREVVLGTHGPGALVGEVTALVGGQRTATLRAVGPTTVQVVTTADLRAVFDRHPTEAAAVTAAARDRTDRSRVATLLAKELGSGDPDAIADIAASVTWRNLEAGEQLFAAGEPADGAYIVLSGRVRIHRPDGSTVAQVGRGAVVGEFGLLEQRSRTASVTALRDTSLAKLSRDDFSAMTSRHANLAMGLVRRIIDRSGQETTAGLRLGRSACVVVTDGLDGGRVIAGMLDAVAEVGRSVHLDPDRVDALLGATGAADTKPGEIGDVRLTELLHQIDAEHDHVLLEADLEHPEWTVTALRRVDQVVIVASASPTAAQERQIHEVMALVPDGTPIWLAVDHPADTVWPEGTPELRRRFGVEEVHHIRVADPIDLGRLGRLAVGAGTALVLGGGGARGFAHIGVMAALDEVGVPIDRFAGASMGSVIGPGLALGLNHEERLDVATRHFHRLMDYTIPVVALLKGKRIASSISAYYGGHDIEDLWRPFACVATNLTTSRVVHLRTGPLDVAIRASTAIPGVLPPVPHEGDLLIDGGVLDNLPVDLVSTDPSIDRVIAVDVAPPRGPRAKSDFGLSVSGWRALWSQMTGRGHTYPGVSVVLMRTMLIGSARDRDQTLAAGAVDLHLDLELKGVGLLEFDSVDKAAAMGYEASKDRIAAWWAEQQAARQGRTPS